MLVRELTGGDPPLTCTVTFVDDPLRFGHRVTDGGRPVAQVLTRREDFERAVAEHAAAGFEETERSLTRRVLTTADRFWIVTLEGNAVCVHAGPIRPDWNEAVGHKRSKHYRDRSRASAAYHRAVAGKREEGYDEQYARDVTIPGGADGPGAKGAR
jgi:predicted DNA-binding WGR domain protein